MLMHSSAQLIGNVEAEACLLGAMMHANNLIDSIADKLKPDDFLEPLHGRIFEAIVKEHGKSHTVTPVTIKPYFEDDPAIKELGGVGYLAQLTGLATFGAHDLAAQVLELSRRRKIVDCL